MKNNQSRKLLALAAAMAFVLAFPAKADLVVNGGFETGDLTGWTLSGNLGFSLVEALSHSGAFGYSNGAVGSLGYISQTLPTTPGESYTLDFWLWSPGGTPNEFQVLWDGGSPIVDLVNLGAFGWTEYTYTELATSSATSLSFGFRQDPSFFHFDDASVQASGVPDSSFTASLLGLGLLGLAALRRRLS